MRIHFESTTEQFEIIIQKAYQAATGNLPLDNSLSWITIEKHDAAGTESADTVESADTTIEITSGANDTFAFRHSLALTSIYTTYTISLDQRVYTTDELVAALNAAIETQGSVANTITTSIAYIDGRFLIRCSSRCRAPIWHRNTI